MQENLLKTSGHGVFAIQWHIIFVTKYRHSCLTKSMLLEMKKHIAEVCKKWRCELLEFNGEEDHVHLLISGHPACKLSGFIANLKTVSARKMRQDYKEHLKKYYWKNIFWSSSYAVFTVGAADLNTVINYIRNQETPA